MPCNIQYLRLIVHLLLFSSGNAGNDVMKTVFAYRVAAYQPIFTVLPPYQVNLSPTLSAKSSYLNFTTAPLEGNRMRWPLVRCTWPWLSPWCYVYFHAPPKWVHWIRPGSCTHWDMTSGRVPFVAGDAHGIERRGTTSTSEIQLVSLAIFCRWLSF